MAKKNEVGEANCQRADFTWKIENFSSLSQTVECFYSPDFHFRDRRWYIKLYPKYVESDDSSEGYVELVLLIADSGSPIELRYSLGIQAASGQTEVWLNGSNTFRKISGGWGVRRGIGKSGLLRRRDELLPQDVLTVTATLKKGGVDEEGTKEVSVGTNVEHEVADVAIQTEDEHKVADVSIQTEDKAGKLEVKEKSGGEKVLQDIGKLWVSGDNSDVVLKVKDVEFKAHRAILGVRTPVLGAMFQHDTEEKASGEVTIEDCDPEVLEQLLHYIYTGAPGVLNAENAAALYVVADKYLVSEVKSLCLLCMKDEMCLDTFSDYVTLSLMYKETDLLEMAEDFLSRNMIRVMETVEWQRFANEHATWANEILIRGMRLIEARNARAMGNLN